MIFAFFLLDRPDGHALRAQVRPEHRAYLAKMADRMAFAGPLVAVVTLAAALWTTQAAGVPLRDPDHVAGRRLVWVVCLVLVLVGLDIVSRHLQFVNA